MGARRAGNRRRLYALNKLGQATVATPGAGAASAVVSSTVVRSGHEIVTEITLDLGSSVGKLRSSGTDKDVIALSASLAANHQAGYLTQLTVADNGYIIAADMTCLEVPTGGATHINLVGNTLGTRKFDDTYDGAGSATLLISGSAWTTLGDFRNYSAGSAALSGALPVSGNIDDVNYYLYIAQGGVATAGEYTAGKYVIRLYGIAVPDDK